MKNKIIIPTILFCIVAILSIYLLMNKEETTINKNNEATSIVLFYGDGCPHCGLVEEYLSQNEIEAKVPFAKKEVYYNKQNAGELAEKAMICGIPTDSIGVPFLWDGSKCLVGDQDIIEFFKSKLNEQ